MTRQCKSCGGFCKKAGCERSNVQPEDSADLLAGIKSKQQRIDELESQMQGLSNEINDFQNTIERQKREIDLLQKQQDTPVAFYEIAHDEYGDIEYEFSVYPRPGFKPLYAQAVAKELRCRTS